ncbi:hypothetical protein F511_15424 [Dorcoceras hygrometricum]|uniref:Uncharacterized protein n=1 Tax=Dorcoceras hygrometricum TaxID=472368 RepID=A0A2Z7A5D7_9LAMI|nr:hypothetical protein F511_15424 [Dorcoceras hygrometricum]
MVVSGEIAKRQKFIPVRVFVRAGFDQLSRALNCGNYCAEYKLLSVLGFDPMSLWGLVCLRVCVFAGYPGNTSGRGFNPAGGAPGGG